MQQNSSDAVKQLKQLFLPDIRLINRQWLQQLLPDYWLEKSLQSNHALKLLSRKFHIDYSIPNVDETALEPCQRWLLFDIDEQNIIAKAIGARVCVRLIRAVIQKHQTAMLVKQLGDEFYLSALSNKEIYATGVTQAEFETYLFREKLPVFLTAVGISALQSTLDRKSEFFRLRMKFSFPKECWNIKPVLSDLDMQALTRCLSESALLPAKDGING